MHIPRACFLVTLVGALSNPRLGVAADLVEVLRARAEAVHTFRADVHLSFSEGAERAAFVKDNLAFTQWGIKKRMISQEEAAVRDTSIRSMLQPDRQADEHYRYSADSSGKMRVELALGTPKKSIVFVYTGSVWRYLVTSGADPAVPARAPQMGLNSRLAELSYGKWLEVARGNAIPMDTRRAARHGFSETAQAVQQVSWQEIVDHCDPVDIVQTQAASPRGGSQQPMLELTSRPSAEDVPIGPVRVRVWFDPAKGYCPSHLQVFEAASDEERTAWDYVIAHAVDWSDIATVDGVTLPLTARVKDYQKFAMPQANDRLGLEKAYEYSIRTFTFSNVAVNAPLDDSCFIIDPPPGTNVIDDVAGEAYIVGSMGEQLHKTALRERAQRSDDVAWISGKNVAIIVCAVAVVTTCLLVVCARLWRVRWRSR